MMVVDGMYWWRVVYDELGNVLVCELAEPREQDGGLVFHVRAKDVKQARDRSHKMYCRARQKIRRAKLKAEGKCQWCARQNDRKPGKRCSACAEQAKLDDANRRARARGEAVARPPKSAAHRARRELEDAQLRLKVLKEVEKAWVKAKTEDDFLDWLSLHVVRAREAARPSFKGAA